MSDWRLIWQVMSEELCHCNPECDLPSWSNTTMHPRDIIVWLPCVSGQWPKFMQSLNVRQLGVSQWTFWGCFGGHFALHFSCPNYPKMDRNSFELWMLLCKNIFNGVLMVDSYCRVQNHNGTMNLFYFGDSSASWWLNNLITLSWR